MVFAVSLVASLVFLSLVFVLSRWLGRLDVVDVAWGLAFVVIAVAGFVYADHMVGLNVASLVVLLVVIWGLRLAAHIAKRLKKGHEDPRYTELRQKWRGSEAVNAYFRVFLLQAVLAFVVALPVVLVNRAPEQGLGWLALAGGLIWLVGFVFEAVGDKQLADFVSQAKNQGRVMDKGLWRYTRHPNYFGELTQWWGIFVVALVVPYGWLGFIGPLVLTVLILFISGIPLNEKRQVQKSGWLAYQKRTSVLLPLPPKKG